MRSGSFQVGVLVRSAILICCMVATTAATYAQGCIKDIVSDGSTPLQPPFLLYPNQECAADLNILIDVAPLVDPVRPWIDSNHDNAPRNKYFPLYDPPATPGQCNYILMDGAGHSTEGYQPGQQNNFTWPTQPATGDGYYFIFWRVYDNSVLKYSGGVYAWVVGGQWTLDPPTGVENPFGGVGSGGVGSVGGLATLKVEVYKQTQHATNLTILLDRNGEYDSKSTGTTGIATFNEIESGQYIVFIDGNFGGTTIHEKCYVYVPPGITHWLQVNLDAGGHISSVGGGSESSVIVAPSASDSPSFWHWLVVPKLSSLTAITEKVNTFMDWGPFTFFAAFDRLNEHTNIAPVAFLPIPQIDQNGLTTVPQQLQVFGGDNWTVGDTSWTASATFQAIRTVMGLGVWLSFAAWLLKVFTPKQVV